MSAENNARNFLDISAVAHDELKSILGHAHSLKQEKSNARLLDGKMLAMIFDKPSTRTRVSFDVGMRQLGGETILLSGSEMQLGRGETISDTAKVLSRYVDAIMIRTTDHDRVTELAEHATIPVINGLTDASHPCQIMADVMTIEEKFGTAENRKVAWSGDGNNVLSSLAEGSAAFGYELNIAVPETRMPDAARLQAAEKAGAKIALGHDAQAAIEGSDCVITDTWTSMGFEDETSGHNTFQPFQVNQSLMGKAQKNAIFMHCLPVHRGEEVTAEVIDGPQSVVFDQAENRLHVQKAILAWCLK